MLSLSIHAGSDENSSDDESSDGGETKITKRSVSTPSGKHPRTQPGSDRVNSDSDSSRASSPSPDEERSVESEAEDVVDDEPLLVDIYHEEFTGEAADNDSKMAAVVAAKLSSAGDVVQNRRESLPAPDLSLEGEQDDGSGDGCRKKVVSTPDRAVGGIQKESSKLELTATVVEKMPDLTRVIELIRPLSNAMQEPMSSGGTVNAMLSLKDHGEGEGVDNRFSDMSELKESNETTSQKPGAKRKRAVRTLTTAATFDEATNTMSSDELNQKTSTSGNSSETGVPTSVGRKRRLVSSSQEESLVKEVSKEITPLLDSLDPKFTAKGTSRRHNRLTDEAGIRLAEEETESVLLLKEKKEDDEEKSKPTRRKRQKLEKLAEEEASVIVKGCDIQDVESRLEEEHAAFEKIGLAVSSAGTLPSKFFTSEKEDDTCRPELKGERSNVELFLRQSLVGGSVVGEHTMASRENEEEEEVKNDARTREEQEESIRRTEAAEMLLMTSCGGGDGGGNRTKGGREGGGELVYNDDDFSADQSPRSSMEHLDEGSSECESQGEEDEEEEEEEQEHNSTKSDQEANLEVETYMRPRLGPGEVGGPLGDAGGGGDSPSGFDFSTASNDEDDDSSESDGGYEQENDNAKGAVSPHRYNEEGEGASRGIYDDDEIDDTPVGTTTKSKLVAHDDNGGGGNSEVGARPVKKSHKRRRRNDASSYAIDKNSVSIRTAESTYMNYTLIRIS